jgi:hypothetical protein
MLNPIELHHYHYCLVLNFSLVLVLALVHLLLCTFSVVACYRPLAVGKQLNKLIDSSRLYLVRWPVTVFTKASCLEPCRVSVRSISLYAIFATSVSVLTSYLLSDLLPLLYVF